MILLQTIDANDQLIEAELDGQTFYVGASWNEEGQFWTLSLRNLSGVMLASCIPAIPEWPLLFQIRNPSMPPGELGVWLRQNATLDREAFLRGDAALVYLEAAELA